VSERRGSVVVGLGRHVVVIVVASGPVLVEPPLQMLARGIDRGDVDRRGVHPEKTKKPGDALAISSYLGASDALDRALAAFGEAYADQNDLDYQALKEAAESGRIDAEMAA
jgi:hypothetical protein